MNIFNDGKWRHLRLQANMLAAGLINDIEVSLPWPNMRSMGTADASGIVPDDHPNPLFRGKTFGVELKGVNMFQYSKYIKEDTQLARHKSQFYRYILSAGWDLYIVLGARQRSLPDTQTYLSADSRMQQGPSRQRPSPRRR
ncbi:hypothetical protein [Catellatospora vulcania]|uniref:hypothetical protein n=1 Tax=Catellatospora vulcania TaxID=1460450 RepID=UPI0012D4953B|nr:hypothetical protein [Catellatospora vulcania]